MSAMTARAQHNSDDSRMRSTRLAKGTPVLVVQRIHQTDPSWEGRTAGVIDTGEEEPTGAWHAHGRNGKL